MLEYIHSTAVWGGWQPVYLAAATEARVLQQIPPRLEPTLGYPCRLSNLVVQVWAHSLPREAVHVRGYLGVEGVHELLAG